MFRYNNLLFNQDNRCKNNITLRKSYVTYNHYSIPNFISIKSLVVLKVDCIIFN